MTDLRKLLENAESKTCIENDPHIDPNERESIFSFINGPDPVGHLVAGTIASYLVNTVTTFLKLTPTTKALLTVAGFGLGNLLANTLVRNTNKGVATTPEGKIITLTS